MPFDRRKSPAFWVTPGDTFYWATVSIPSLYYERLGEAGIDFAVLYPTAGLMIPHDDDDECRVELCRLFNDYLVEQFGPYFDRFAPAALIPMHTPDEAVEALEHASSVGLKVGLIPSYVSRITGSSNGGLAAPYPGVSTSRRIDTYGIDSEYDYDPVWAKAIDLGRRWPAIRSAWASPTAPHRITCTTIVGTLPQPERHSRSRFSLAE